MNFIKKSFKKFAPRSTADLRDSRIFFIMKKERNPFKTGTRDLISFYGGEQLYFSIRENYPSVAKKICTLGEPLLVKIKLNIKEIDKSLYMREFVYDFLSKKRDTDFFITSAVMPENLKVYQISQANNEIIYTKL